MRDVLNGLVSNNLTPYTTHSDTIFHTGSYIQVYMDLLTVNPEGQGKDRNTLAVDDSGEKGNLMILEL